MFFFSLSVHFITIEIWRRSHQDLASPLHPGPTCAPSRVEWFTWCVHTAIQTCQVSSAVPREGDTSWRTAVGECPGR